MTSEMTSVIARGAGMWVKGDDPETALRAWLRAAKPNSAVTVDMRAVDAEAWVDDGGSLHATHSRELPSIEISREDVRTLLAVEDMIFERVTRAEEAFDGLREAPHAPAP